MALQLSPRVTKTMAAQMCAGMQNEATTDAYSRLAIAFIRNDVAIPTNSAEIYGYLNTALNHSNYGGAYPSNTGFMLGVYVFPDLNTEIQFGQSDSNPNIASYVGPTTITGRADGTIGSIIVYSPNAYTGNNGSSYQSSALSTSSTVNSTSAVCIPSGITLSTYNAYAPMFFRGVSFCTDSVGLVDSSAMVKLSTLEVTQGQPFTLHSINAKVGSF